MGPHRLMRLAGAALFLAIAAPPGAWGTAAVNVPSPKDYALAKLRGAGVSDALAALAEKVHVPEERDRIVELNVLGFLGKADYSGHYSKKAVRKCREFLRRYRKSLGRMEARYGVSREAVAALLWVETKHGTQLGKLNVLHVYYSLLQAPHPDVLEGTLGALTGRAPASAPIGPSMPDSKDEHRRKAIERSGTKADWALAELLALDAIRKKGVPLETLNGSYAGAFGIPQFIPSSYIEWARPATEGAAPNLFDMKDAIQSVGHYLKANGWKARNKESHRKALHHYNRADGYVAVILKIARELKARP